jgi:hypothetical protein
LKAAQAEGVPISKERYARLGKTKRMLSETPIFTSLDSSELGGYLEASPHRIIRRCKAICR